MTDYRFKHSSEFYGVSLYPNHISYYPPLPPLQMTDTTQSKEIIQKYHRVFLNSLHFEMAREDEMKFMANQFNEIEGEIELALKFIAHIQYSSS